MLLSLLLAQTTVTAALSIKGGCEEHGLSCSCPEACARERGGHTHGETRRRSATEGESCHSAPGSPAASDSCRLLAGCRSNNLPALHPDHVPLILVLGTRVRWTDLTASQPAGYSPSGSLQRPSPPTPPPKALISSL